MQKIVDAAKLSGNVVLMTPFPSDLSAASQAAQDVIVAAIKQLGVANSLPVINNPARFGSYTQAAAEGRALDFYKLHPEHERLCADGRQRHRADEAAGVASSYALEGQTRGRPGPGMFSDTASWRDCKPLCHLCYRQRINISGARDMMLVLISLFSMNGLPSSPSAQTYGPNGALERLKGVVAGRRIGPSRVRGAYRAIETDSGASLQRSTIIGVDAVVTRDCIRLRDAVDVVIRNVQCRHGPTPSTPGHLPEGIAIASGRNVTIEDSRFDGFQMHDAADRYWNGDGIATERSLQGLTLRRVVLTNNSDAGIDTKSANVVLDQVHAAGNKRNFRFWAGPVSASTLTSETPVQRGGAYGPAHIWISGEGGRMPTIRIKHLIVRSSNHAPIFVVEDGPADITIERCTIDVPRGTPFKDAGDKRMRWKLGPGCSVPG